MISNFNIVPLTRKQLQEAIDQNTYWQNNVVAMPKSKAIWLLKNERIASEDYVAIIGLENNEIVGYTLIIPDIIQTSKNETFKINWVHIWWVNKKYNGEIVGPFIFNKTLKILNKNVLLNSYLENTNKFFSKGPFNIINKRPRFTVFFNLEPSIIVSRIPVFKYLKWLITICNKTLIIGVNYLNYKKANKVTGPLTYEYINELDDESWQYIKEKCKNDFTVKSKNYINWQIDNTQYTQTPIQKKFRFTYSTTGYSPNIYSYTVKIMEEKSLIGFLSYVLNGLEFNLKYFICKDTTLEKKCLAVLIEHFIKSKASYIITDDSKLAHQIKKQYITVYTYQIEKKGIAHKNLKINFEGTILTDRDGRFH